jgi:hypothetical protein
MTRDEALERIIRERIQSAHVLRCVLQGHHGSPCQFCGATVKAS